VCTRGCGVGRGACRIIGAACVSLAEPNSTTTILCVHTQTHSCTSTRLASPAASQSRRLLSAMVCTWRTRRRGGLRHVATIASACSACEPCVCESKGCVRTQGGSRKRAKPNSIAEARACAGSGGVTRAVTGGIWREDHMHRWPRVSHVTHRHAPLTAAMQRCEQHNGPIATTEKAAPSISISLPLCTQTTTTLHSLAPTGNLMGWGGGRHASASAGSDHYTQDQC
jgi:hypothetical protein